MPRQRTDRLSTPQVIAGDAVVCRNVQRLADDALLLFENGRYAAALQLSVLALEEYGKRITITALALGTDDALPRHWQHFYDHAVKNSTWVLASELLRRGPDSSDAAIAAFFASDPSQSRITEESKQQATYVDFEEDGSWSDPTAVGKTEALKFLGPALLVGLASKSPLSLDDFVSWSDRLLSLAEDEVVVRMLAAGSGSSNQRSKALQDYLAPLLDIAGEAGPRTNIASDAGK